MPNVQVRGVNSLPTTDVTNLNAEYKGNSNLPTFILDGFEVSVEKIYDLDPNRVSNISILKDASATAIYGSRASNGVVIIDTKAPESGRLRLNYTGIKSSKMLLMHAVRTSDVGRCRLGWGCRVGRRNGECHRRCY